MNFFWEILAHPALRILLIAIALGNNQRVSGSLSVVYGAMWPSENIASISWDFSCPIIEFQGSFSTKFAMLKPLNLVPFYTVPGISSSAASQFCRPMLD